MTDETVKPKSSAKPPETPRRADPLDAVAKAVIAFLTFLGESVLLAWQSVRTLVRGGVDSRDLVAQMSAVGADSIWIVLANNLATGAVFALYTTTLSLQVGFTEFVGGTLAYGFLNELGPMLSGVSLASRSGAAIAAEIGSMVVTEQVDAVRAMAVSPVRYLVAPRVLAATFMLPLLTILGDIAGIFGGYLSARSHGVPHVVFWDSVYKYAHPEDLMRGLIKAVVFGFLIGLVACQQGLRAKGGATGVGRATTSSVVVCVMLIFLSDVFLAQILTQLIKTR